MVSSLVSNRERKQQSILMISCLVLLDVYKRQVVRPDANKLEIKKEVEALYNVTVVDVNTVKYACLLYTSLKHVIRLILLSFSKLR